MSASASLPPIPTSEPTDIYAGDTALWTKQFDAYSPADGWILSYFLTNAQKNIAIAASCVTQDTTDGDTFDITIPASTTAAWTPGEYLFNAYVTSADQTQRFTVATGVIQVHPNLATESGPLDYRTPSRVILDNLTAVIENRATTDVMEYTIGGRMLKKMSFTELTQMHRLYAWRVARENGSAPNYLGFAFRSPLSATNNPFDPRNNGGTC
jgi:hypothetical protein